MLNRHGIALWDVLARCERDGSLDSAIRAEQPNDIESLLQEHPSIRLIALNGRKAASSFRKHICLSPGVSVLELPSSSAANALQSFEEKCDQWLGLRTALAAPI